MRYSKSTLEKIIGANLSVFNEIEARDAVFRENFTDEQRRKITPWIMSGRVSFQQEEFDIWLSLQEKIISEKQAIENMTELMEQYYNHPYPLT